MRLKSYEAADMNEAMDAIRHDMGDEAVILSVIRASRGKGIKVTAAAGAEQERSQVADMQEAIAAAEEELQLEPEVHSRRASSAPRQSDFFPDDKRPEVLHTLERV